MDRGRRLARSPPFILRRMPTFRHALARTAPRARTAARARAAAGALAAASLVLTSCASGRAAVMPRETWGFVAFWDERSTTSLAAHGVALDVAVTTWIALDSLTGAPETLHEAPAAATRGPRRTMALLTSWRGAGFHPAAVRRLASDPAGLEAAATRVAGRVAGLGHAGIVIDFEGHAPTDRESLARVVRAVAAAARRTTAATVVVAIPATDTAGYPARLFLDAGAAAVLPMLYDQHWSGGPPGPVAAPAWVGDWLAVRVREAGPAAVIAGLPLYGYHWRGAGRGSAVTYAEAGAAATAARVALERDSASTTLRARLGGGELWVSDATLLAALLRVAEDAGVRRVALWHLGQEDPAIWPVIERRR